MPAKSYKLQKELHRTTIMLVSAKVECIYHTPRDISTDGQNSTILRDESSWKFHLCKIWNYAVISAIFPMLAK
jgi:hypothetical protein